jgi:hypothetical protein
VKEGRTRDEMVDADFGRQLVVDFGGRAQRRDTLRGR